jgi:hypothetical protein
MVVKTLPRGKVAMVVVVVVERKMGAKVRRA